ncbi:MAG: hypothetical protein ABW019_15275, partial [Chitinophagaceae bacterium]
MKYLIFAAFFLHGLILFGQRTNTEIEINPFGADSNKVCLKYGTYVKFRISHVNPFRIEGATSVTKKSVEFDVPAQLSSLLSGAQPESGAVSELIKQKQDSIGSLRYLMAAKWNSGIDRQIAALEAQIEELKKVLKEKEDRSLLQSEFIANYNCFVKALNELSLYTSIEEYIDTAINEIFIRDVNVLKSNLKSYMMTLSGG